MLAFSRHFRTLPSIGRIINALNLPINTTTSSVLVARVKLDFPLLASRKSVDGIAAERREILTLGTGLGARTGRAVDKFGGEGKRRSNQGKKNRADHHIDSY